MLWNGLISGIKPLLPIFMPIIVAGVVWGIIKYFVRNTTYNFSRMSGNSKKQARNHAKRVEIVVDIISAIDDVKEK